MGLSLSLAEAHFGSVDRGFHAALSWFRAACAPWGLEPGVGVNAVAPATPVRGTSSFQEPSAPVGPLHRTHTG